jgi:hypothetical protein
MITMKLSQSPDIACRRALTLLMLRYRNAAAGPRSDLGLWWRSQKVALRRLRVDLPVS